MQSAWKVTLAGSRARIEHLAVLPEGLTLCGRPFHVNVDEVVPVRSDCGAARCAVCATRAVRMTMRSAGHNRPLSLG